MARPNYRRKNERDTWHFCKNCNNWPTSKYVSKSVKPTTGEFCNECLAKVKRGDCK